jgi:hypothetical protein
MNSGFSPEAGTEQLLARLVESLKPKLKLALDLVSNHFLMNFLRITNSFRI